MIPKLFLKELFVRSDEDYEEWIRNGTLANEFFEEGIIEAIADTIETEKPNVENKTKFAMPKPIFHPQKHIPREFIRGFFSFCDGTFYTQFLSNPEAAMDHLSYTDNPYLYNNLPYEERVKFLEDFRQRKNFGGKAK